MRLAVYGAGGVGGYFGGRLAQAGEEVVFIARGEHLQAIQQHGLRVESALGDFHVYPAQATGEPAQVGSVAAVLVGVKAWQVSEAAEAIKPLLAEDTIIVPLQNGVDAPGQLSAVLGPKGVLGGLCKISALVIAPGCIRHAALEPYIGFGALDGRTIQQEQRLVEAFQRAGVRAEIPADIQSAMWDKFLFIAAFSGVCALTRAPSGVVRQLPGVRRMLEDAMWEIYELARKRGVSLPEDIVARTMAFIDGLPPASTPSMMRDFLAGKPSELEYQNGAVVRMGSEAQLPVPVNTFIYNSLLPQELAVRGQLDS